MIKVYFEIFGTRLVKQLDEKQYETMTDEQIEYFVRGKLKVNKVVKENVPQNNPFDFLINIFDKFDGKMK